MLMMEIANCGAHQDVKCLCSKATYDKIARWIDIYGIQGTWNLIRLACCAQPALETEQQLKAEAALYIAPSNRAKPAGKVVIGKIDYKVVPKEEPKPPPAEVKPAEVKPVEKVCVLPARGLFSN